MKTMAAQLSQLSADCSARRKELENTHLLVQQRDASGEPSVRPLPGSSDVLHGHLFKRSRRKSKTWKRYRPDRTGAERTLRPPSLTGICFRCWFSIRDNQLLYRKTHEVGGARQNPPCSGVDDGRGRGSVPGPAPVCRQTSGEPGEALLLPAAVCPEVRGGFRAAPERREGQLCVCVCVCAGRCCVLQADSEQLKQSWLGALQGSIHLAYRDGGERHLAQAGSCDRLRPRRRPSVYTPSVRRSARCLRSRAEQTLPRGRGLWLWAWPSEALGTRCAVTVGRRSLAGPPSTWGSRCASSVRACTGERLRGGGRVGGSSCRSLGVHLSKVRSLTLDSWEPEQLKLLCILGNDVINQIYEARCPEEGRDKPRADSQRAAKESWIRQKYVDKSFVRSGGSAGEDQDVTLGLYRAALAGDLVAMAAALAQGAEVNGSLSGEQGRTALIGAAVGGSLLACEFLLLNGAKVNHRDLRGQGALHAAATAGHTGQVCLLLRRGANQYAADETGQDPLAIAVETAHADIVTLLRMARMNEEMRDSEGAFGPAGDDETFQDIFRDFSDMASHDPEKLSR
ncbi:unnamed protein product, partial [Tetraodon nigroviridis]